MVNYQIAFTNSMRRSILFIFVCTEKPLPLRKFRRIHPLSRKEKGKDLWMQRVSRLHQSILYAKTQLKLRKNLLLYQQVTLSLSLLTSLHRAMFQTSQPERRPANFAFHHTLFVRTRIGF
ncbi:hypothetical protein CDAR_397981 [Caerostris darwini]|uniref:Uncharacterized protein n=1 Tax=Caerostris darwini TaxID=1538125 RepID=A0AAV4MN63_9ARAC|nr:hypothetical protein CDAR_397981 [Caerostris darwini]